MKYLRSATFGCKDKEMRKSEFVATTQFLCKNKWKMEEKRESDNKVSIWLESREGISL